MEAGTAIAGVISIALGIGHGALGLVWVLPKIDRDHLPDTPFGSRRTTEHLIRVTWHIVTVFAVASGGILLTLAAARTSDAETVLLRGFAAMWIVATAMAFYVTRSRLRGITRLPVPLMWLVVALLCWQAST